MRDSALAQLHWVQKFIEGMLREGLREVVISPGSRSTPIALVCERHPEIKTRVQVDERSAAFYALGLAKASGLPVAVAATSGSAPAHWYPAVIEASMSNIELILLSADRPLELYHCGANQTIDQSHLFGIHVRQFYQLPVAQEEDHHRRYIYQLGRRIIRDNRGAMPGPVHVNMPLVEPLVPDLVGLVEKVPEKIPDLGVTPEPGIGSEQIKQILDVISSGNGAIVCGPGQFDEGFYHAISTLAQQLAVPVFADPLSGLRFGSHDLSNVITHYDTFLRQQTIEADWILRFGTYPVSKYLSENLMANESCQQFLIDEYGRWSDPLNVLRDVIKAEPTDFCNQLADLVVPVGAENWLGSVMQKEMLAIEKLKLSTCTEAAVIKQCLAQIPEHSLIFCSNSMPVRDLDSFSGKLQKTIQVLANRGVSGIDGNLSTLLGLAAGRGVNDSPVIGLIGDLAFFHDMNGLLMAKHANAIIVIFNNNGGLIFQHLPQATLPEFNDIWRTPTDLDFSKTAELYELPFQRISSADDFTAAFDTALLQTGTRIIEILIDPQLSLREHRNYWQSLNL